MSPCREETESGPVEGRRGNDGISQLAETNPGDPQTPPRHLYSLPDIVMVAGFVSDWSPAPVPRPWTPCTHTILLRYKSEFAD